MTAPNVDVVTEAFAGALVLGEQVDLAEALFDEEVLGSLGARIAPEAVVEFATPDGGFVGDMAGPFRGIEGFKAGWREWLAPWAEFLFTASELLDAGEGKVLLLGDSVGRMTSGTELATKVAALYTVRDGVMVSIEHFLDQDQAREAAGL